MGDVIHQGPGTAGCVAICDAERGSRDTLAGDASLSIGWLAGCAALAAGGHWLLATGSAGLAAPHPMIALAGAALLSDFRRMTPRPAARIDGLLFALALLFCLAPLRTATAPALVCVGWLALRGGGRPGAVLLFALAGWALKDAVWAGFASVPLLWTETNLTALALRLGGLAAEADGNRILMADGGRFVMLRSCSVLSLAYPCAIGVYALCRLMRPQASVPGWRIGGALALLTLVNLVRLVAMAASPVIYDYLHGPRGVLPLQLAWAGVALAAALPRGRA